LKIDDLKEVLLIDNIDENPNLADIVYRIKTVIRLIFDTSTDYKLYFGENFQMARTATVANANMPVPIPVQRQNKQNAIEKAVLNIKCPKCRKKHEIPGYFDIDSNKIKQLKLPISNKIQDNDVLICDGLGCNFAIDLKPVKNQIEAQSKRKITFK
jgi:hypothetical protein